jgi:hypothetical protein
MQGLHHNPKHNLSRNGNLARGVLLWKLRMLGKKRWGKRFRSVLAEIARVRSLGDPLIRLLTFFCFDY